MGRVGCRASGVPGPAAGQSLRIGNTQLERLGNTQLERLGHTVTGVFGGATSNGTWAAGVGHINSFRNDTIRYTGVVAYANVIADFYVLDQPFEFNLEGLIIYNDLKFRVAESNWFLGAALSYMDATTAFKIDLPEPPDSSKVDGEFLASDFKDVGRLCEAAHPVCVWV